MDRNGNTHGVQARGARRRIARIRCRTPAAPLPHRIAIRFESGSQVVLCPSRVRGLIAWSSSTIKGDFASRLWTRSVCRRTLPESVLSLEVRE